MQELKERLVNQVYNKTFIDHQFSEVKTIDKNKLLKEKKTHDKESQKATPLVLTFCQTLATLFENTGIYLILAENVKDYSEKN